MHRKTNAPGVKKFVIFGALFGFFIIPLSTLGLGLFIAEMLFVPFIIIPRWFLSLFVDIVSGGNFLVIYLMAVSVLWYGLLAAALGLLFKKTGKGGVIAVIVIYYLALAFFGVASVRTTTMPAPENISRPGEIKNFAECVAAGNPVMESYPRRCRSEYGLFVENVEEEFKKDIICDGPEDVCLREIECEDGFMAEEGEVCGKVNVQCITTPCDPVEETFNNRCEAREREAFDIRAGSCEYWQEHDKFIDTQEPVTYSIEYPKKWYLDEKDKRVMFTKEKIDTAPKYAEGYAYGFYVVIARENFVDSNLKTYEEWLDLHGMTDKNELFIESSNENINGYQMRRVVTEAAGAEGRVLHYLFFVDIQRILVFSQYPYNANTDDSKDFERTIRTFKIEDSESDVISSEEIIKKKCRTSTECSVPMEYAIQSNCPYSGACVDGSCAVVCPMWEHLPNQEESTSYRVACSADNDCDCSGWDRAGAYECRCIDERCASLVLTRDMNRTVSWSEAIRILRSGEAEQVFQTHNLNVTLKLKDGRTIETTEPGIDDIFKEVDRCGDVCAGIALGTE